MKIVVFAPNVPYPPHGGGRADIWRRMDAMTRLGHKVMLVTLFEPFGPAAPTVDHWLAIDSLIDRRFVFPIRRDTWKTLRQLANCLQVPWHLANRIPSQSELSELIVSLTQFQPDCFWLDGPWFGVTCEQLVQTIDVPILYRSHNIEHQYLRKQAQAAVHLRDRVAWTLASIGLKATERRLMKKSRAIFDISVDDMAFWRDEGILNLHWLPPLPELVFSQHPDSIVACDVVFVGNLGTPNNVRGVEWLLREIFPRLQKLRPDVSCLLVGSNPTTHVLDLVCQTRGVSLEKNVPDVLPYLFGARVLVNPIMVGSGVQVKMLDMLMTDNPIVTTSQGTRGLPRDFKSLFRVADDPTAFALSINDELVSPTVDLAARRNARTAFCIDKVGQALSIAMGQ